MDKVFILQNADPTRQGSHGGIDWCSDGKRSIGSTSSEADALRAIANGAIDITDEKPKKG